MYLWYNFFLWIISIFVVAYFIGLALEPRWTKYPRWIWAMVYTVLTLVPAYIKFSNTGTYLENAMYYVAVASIILYVFLVFKNKLWQKLLILVLFIVIIFFCELIILKIMALFGVDFDVTFSTIEMAAMETLMICILLGTFGFFVMVWNKVMYKQSIKKNTWIYLIFPFSQFLILSSLDQGVDLFYGNFWALLGISIGMIADLILFFILMEQSKKELLERSIEELTRQHELEDLHYRNMQLRHIEIEKIRHDFNNQLAAIHQLLEDNNYKLSEEVLSHLQQDISVKKEYCKHPIINAVFIEKSSLCTQNQINLETDIQISNDIEIKPLHLCSVFSNLLDNAIHAACKCPHDKRHIKVQAFMTESYVVIKFENYIETLKSEKNTDRKQYGQLILKDIAQMYAGEFKVDLSNDLYSSSLILKAVTVN
jgi:hypothetical protein